MEKIIQKAIQDALKVMVNASMDLGGGLQVFYRERGSCEHQTQEGVHRVWISKEACPVQWEGVKGKGKGTAHQMVDTYDWTIDMFQWHCAHLFFALPSLALVDSTKQAKALNEQEKTWNELVNVMHSLHVMGSLHHQWGVQWQGGRWWKDLHPSMAQSEIIQPWWNALIDDSSKETWKKTDPSWLESLDQCQSREDIQALAWEWLRGAELERNMENVDDGESPENPEGPNKTKENQPPPSSKKQDSTPSKNPSEGQDEEDSQALDPSSSHKESSKRPSRGPDTANDEKNKETRKNNQPKQQGQENQDVQDMQKGQEETKTSQKKLNQMSGNVFDDSGPNQSPSMSQDQLVGEAGAPDEQETNDQDANESRQDDDDAIDQRESSQEVDELDSLGALLQQWSQENPQEKNKPMKVWKELIEPCEIQEVSSTARQPIHEFMRGNKSTLNPEKILAAENNIKKLLKGQTRQQVQEEVGKKISIRHWTQREVKYTHKKDLGPGCLSLHLVVDCSGSMDMGALPEGNDLAMNGARHLLAALSRLSQKGWVHGHVTLSAQEGSTTYALPLPSDWIDRLSGFSGSEGLKNALKSTMDISKKADMVWVFTDAQITDSAFSYEEFKKYNVEPMGLYCGKLNEVGQKQMERYFNQWIVRDCVEELAFALVQRFKSFKSTTKRKMQLKR